MTTHKDGDTMTKVNDLAHFQNGDRVYLVANPSTTGTVRRAAWTDGTFSRNALIQWDNGDFEFVAADAMDYWTRPEPCYVPGFDTEVK